MKDRIKKFMQEHETAVNLALIITGATSAIVGAAILIKGDGHHVNGVFSGNDVAKGSTVFVTLKNGTVLPYTKPEA